MGQSFKALVHVGETLSDDFTQIVAVIDGQCWELDSVLSAVRKDACGYRRTNAANLTGGANYVPGELETAVGRAQELMQALKPVAELAARWNAEDFAAAKEGCDLYEAAKATGDPGKPARFEIKV
ncbi:MAG TPA: hypothetical protein VKQ30_16230 [Ktedonobacterales bacterium]|nr:hypothetical protein [Ktedonobacterales bacterium]